MRLYGYHNSYIENYKLILNASDESGFIKDVVGFNKDFNGGEYQVYAKTEKDEKVTIYTTSDKEKANILFNLIIDEILQSNNIIYIYQPTKEDKVKIGKAI